MTDAPPPPKRRASSDDATRRRRALQIAQPYMARFPEWQKRAAYISAALLARTLTSEERSEQLESLRQLVAEVESERDRFDQTVMEANRHSRIDDVRNAFRRLLEILNATGR